jgi:bifunctional non-homologous end joining protein LigD
VKRRELLEKYALPKLAEPVRYSPVLEAGLKDLIRSVKAQGLEGLVAKRRNSKYEPGLRSGAWQKMRVNRGQEFVIAGYTPSPKNFDALVIGYYEGSKLMYAARTGNGLPTGRGSCVFSTMRSSFIQPMPSWAQSTKNYAPAVPR